jgi:hypothetical protein
MSTLNPKLKFLHLGDVHWQPLCKVALHRAIGFLNLICQGQIEPAVAFSQEQAVFSSNFFGLVVKSQELITLGLHPSIEQPSVSNAGQHLTAKQFHTILERAALSAECVSSQCNPLEAAHTDCISANTSTSRTLSDSGKFSLDIGKDPESITISSHEERMQVDEGNSDEKEYVLLDARNIYETRIGKFRPPPGVAFHDPMLRQYSDLPSWLDANADQLRNKQVLMYVIFHCLIT